MRNEGSGDRLSDARRRGVHARRAVPAALIMLGAWWMLGEAFRRFDARYRDYPKNTA